MRMVLSILTVGMVLAPAAWATVWPVSITEFAFTPDTVNVAQGDTVIWTNNGVLRHSSTSGTGGIPDSIWDSGLLSPAATYSQPFPNTGSFPYFCTVHPSTMTGTVVVGPPTGFEEGRQVLVPTSLALAVSPNPFRSSASIRYSPRGSSPVSLEIIDLNGRLVRAIEPGIGRAQWDGTAGDGRQAQAGVYLVQLSQGANRNYARLVKLQ